MKALQKPCETHRLRFLKHKANSLGSVFIPRCNEDGYYAPMQCTAKNKYCWCVDKNGKKKKGSRTRGLTDCSKSKDKGNFVKIDLKQGHACVGYKIFPEDCRIRKVH